MRLLAPALLAAGAIAGCGGGSGGGDAAGPRATIERYFAAVGAGKPDAACAELNERSRERLAEFAKPLGAQAEGCSATMRVVLSSRYGQRLAKLGRPVIDDIKTTGDRATATVDGVDQPLVLTRDAGTWRIEFTPDVEADKLPGGAEAPTDSDSG